MNHGIFNSIVLEIHVPWLYWLPSSHDPHRKPTNPSSPIVSGHMFLFQCPCGKLYSTLYLLNYSVGESTVCLYVHSNFPTPNACGTISKSCLRILMSWETNFSFGEKVQFLHFLIYIRKWSLISYGVNPSINFCNVITALTTIVCQIFWDHHLRHEYWIMIFLPQLKCAQHFCHTWF